jgi:hypothetical protein
VLATLSAVIALIDILTAITTDGINTATGLM